MRKILKKTDPPRSALPIHSFLLIFFLMISGGCGQSNETAEEFETIAQGINSDITSKKEEAIRDPNSWSAFWESHAGPDSETPFVDFNLEMVLVVHLGTRETRDAQVRITAVEEDMENILVHYEELVPRSGCITRGVTSNPYHFIKFRRIEKDPLFFKTEQIHDCV